MGQRLNRKIDKFDRGLREIRPTVDEDVARRSGRIVHRLPGVAMESDYLLPAVPPNQRLRDDGTKKPANEKGN